MRLSFRVERPSLAVLRNGNVGKKLVWRRDTVGVRKEVLRGSFAERYRWIRFRKASRSPEVAPLRRTGESLPADARHTLSSRAPPTPVLARACPAVRLTMMSSGGEASRVPKKKRLIGANGGRRATC